VTPMLDDAGVLPPTIGDLTGLLQLYAHSRTRSHTRQPAIHRTLESHAYAVDGVYSVLDSNLLYSTIPTSLLSMSSIQTLSLMNNTFSGTNSHTHSLTH